MANPSPTPVALATLGGVMLCWFIFAGIFIFRKKPPQAPEARRDRTASIGIFLQMVGYTCVWVQPPHRVFLQPLFTGVAEIVYGVVTVSIAVLSELLVAAAVRHLGKQWAVSARLVEDHKLITSGPYAYVRNPIYTGMLGMLIATGLAMHHLVLLAVGIVIFMTGLVIRVRTEEKLLRAAFGAEFEEYAKRVPAVIPGVY